jgi:hypothetical protein
LPITPPRDTPLMVALHFLSVFRHRLIFTYAERYARLTHMPLVATGHAVAAGLRFRRVSPLRFCRDCFDAISMMLITLPRYFTPLLPLAPYFAFRYEFDTRRRYFADAFSY